MRQIKNNNLHENKQTNKEMLNYVTQRSSNKHQKILHALNLNKTIIKLLVKLTKI